MTTTRMLKPRDKVLVTVTTSPTGAMIGYFPARRDQAETAEVMQVRYAFPAAANRRQYAKTTVGFTNGREHNYLTTTEWTLTDRPVTIGGPVPVDWEA